MTYKITIADSPQLEILAFPLLNTVYELWLDQAPALTNLSLPTISTLGIAKFTGAPKLTLLNLPHNEELDLTFIDVPRLDYFSTFRNISSATKIETSNCFDFRNLQYAGYLSISASEACDVSLDSLTTMGTLIFRNLSGVYFGNGPISVENVFVLDKNTFDPKYQRTSDIIGLDKLTTVGSSVHITANLNAQLPFDGLMTIGGDLQIVNNTNCTINFNHLTEVKNLYMLDNIATELPLLSALRTAGDIHLRGDINT